MMYADHPKSREKRETVARNNYRTCTLHLQSDPTMWDWMRIKLGYVSAGGTVVF